MTPPILEEIRRVRHEISAEIGHDPRRIVEYYAELQRSVRARTVNLSGERPTEHATESTTNLPIVKIIKDESISATR